MRSEIITHSYRNTTPVRACAPRYRSQISYPFRGCMSGGAVILIPCFWDFPVFDTLNAIRALRAWCMAKKDPFYADDVQTPMETYPPWSQAGGGGGGAYKFTVVAPIYDKSLNAELGVQRESPPPPPPPPLFFSQKHLGVLWIQILYSTGPILWTKSCP